MKTSLQEIADSMEDFGESYEKAYRRWTKKYPWLEELLMASYDEMCKKIKLRSDKAEFLSYDNAAKAMDKAVLNTVAIFDRFLQNVDGNTKTT